jgi:nitroimidazol reductase NimA-like FMN-containing flavoprotein (pyridoxamine 5'-phosphate oxidase superfamily)
MPRMSSEEIDKLLSRMALVRIATVDADGSPLVVPVAYVLRDRKILLTAREKVRWLANIRRDPRVCLAIDQDRYPLSKVTVRGRAEIVYEPGRDDEWRDVRLPLFDESTAHPVQGPTGEEEWPFQAAYHLLTRDEPRALVAISLDDSKVTSWRMPLVGEYLDESWAPSYYKEKETESDSPGRFRVIRVGRTLDDVAAVAE